MTTTPTPTTNRAIRATPDATHEWMTVEQAADWLQISVSSIRSYIRQGKIEARRIAGRREIRIHRSELAILLEPIG